MAVGGNGKVSESYVADLAPESGQEIYQLSCSEHSTRSTPPSTGESPFAQNPGFLKSDQRSMRTLGSNSIPIGDGLAIHDRVLRQILNNASRH
jgi:hypothetical protein